MRRLSSIKPVCNFEHRKQVWRWTWLHMFLQDLYKELKCNSMIFKDTKILSGSWFTSWCAKTLIKFDWLHFSDLCGRIRHIIVWSGTCSYIQTEHLFYLRVRRHALTFIRNTRQTWRYTNSTGLVPFSENLQPASNSHITFTCLKRLKFVSISLVSY